MFFKKITFIATFLIFLPTCGLDIGEESENPFIYKVKDEVNFCGILDYKKELKDYMNSLDQEASSKRVEYVFHCMAFKIDQYEKGITGSHQDHFTNTEILKLLKEPFLSTEHTSPFIDTFTNPVYYPKFLNIKSSLVGIMRRHQIKHPDFADQCSKPNEQALSREEVDTFTVFLKDFAKVLVSIDVSSESLFLALQDSQSISLKDDLFSASFKTIIKSKPWDMPPPFFQHINEEKLDLVVDSLISMLLDYDKYSGEGILTRGHIKYMLLNMHLVEIIFNLYDKNTSLILEEDELLNSLCLFEPIISLLTSFHLEDKALRAVWRPFFSEEVVFNYILKYKEIPKQINWRVLKIRSFNTDEELRVFPPEDFSIDYSDVTQIFRNLVKNFIK